MVAEMSLRKKNFLVELSSVPLLLSDADCSSSDYEEFEPSCRPKSKHGSCERVKVSLQSFWRMVLRYCHHYHT